MPMDEETSSATDRDTEERLTPIWLYVLVSAEAFVALYLALLAHVFNLFMESDAFALHAQAIDWWLIAAQRLLLTLIATTIYGLLCYSFNRMLFRLAGRPWQRFSRRCCGLSMAVILIGAATGAARFILEQPFI